MADKPPAIWRGVGLVVQYGEASGPDYAIYALPKTKTRVMVLRIKHAATFPKA